jgi:hypothetical protein
VRAILGSDCLRWCEHPTELTVSKYVLRESVSSESEFIVVSERECVIVNQLLMISD